MKKMSGRKKKSSIVPIQDWKDALIHKSLSYVASPAANEHNNTSVALASFQRFLVKTKQKRS